MERIRDGTLNCPNCGQPIIGAKCEYCGTIFYDFANLDADGISYVRLKMNGTLCVFRAVINRVESEIDCMDSCLFADDKAVTRYIRPETRLTVEMTLLPDDKGVLMTLADREWERSEGCGISWRL